MLLISPNSLTWGVVTGFEPPQLLLEERLILSAASCLGSLHVMPGDSQLCQFSGHMENTAGLG